MAADLGGVETRQVAADEADIRLDRWFKRHYPGLAFGRLAKLLRTGQVRVDGKRAKPSQRLVPGQEVRIPPLPHHSGEAATSDSASRMPGEAEAQRLRDAVLYRDDWVIALDKPAGLATQGGTGVKRNLDAMLGALRFDAAEPPRLVHRLDQDTSGVLLLGRTAEAANRLTRAFRSKDARKLYWALTAGIPKPRRGRIDLPLGKLKRGGGEKMGHDPKAGKEAVTLYATVETTRRPAEVAWLVLSPLTGRTHQLRAHLAELGAPILGDGKYGGRKAYPEGVPVHQLQLHAREIALPHPADGTTLRVTAPLPAHMRALFAALEFDAEAGAGVDPAGN